MALAIPRARLLDPNQNAPFAIVAVALSFYVFAYSTIFGQVSILLLYAFWLPLSLLAPTLLTEAPRQLLLILLLPALAVLSAIWSDVTSATLRAAIQYGTTVICGLIAARVVSLRSLALGGLIGGVAILAYSWSEGTYGYDFVDASYAFQGAFQSKNQLGFYASLTALLSAALIFMPRVGWPLRAAGAAAALFALYTLMLTDSATSVLSLLAGVLAAGIVSGLMRIDIAVRAQGLVLLFCLAVAAVGLAIYLGALDTIFAVFGKDPTLTGRTYLWNQGILFGEDQPALGLGYSAFWVRGRTEAEDLWREFYINARTGFHFHNTPIEAYVALGIVGVGLVAGWMIGLAVGTLRLLMSPGRRAEATLCAGLVVIFLIRAFVEIDFFTPYTTGSFLVPFLLLRMADQRRAVLDASVRPAFT
jgi:exopolysaccharide production protein ExoQ